MRQAAKHGPYIAGVCCDDVRREMPDLIAMRLEPDRTAQLHEHIALCADCNRLMELMRGKTPVSFNHHHTLRQAGAIGHEEYGSSRRLFNLVALTGNGDRR
jgi:hypothetical protein